MFANVRSNLCNMTSSTVRMRQRSGAITAARERIDLSKAELARRIGVSRSLMTEMEAGTRNATEDNLQKLARELDCPIEELREGDQA
jgi:transcriptional regulator with XRE-family HTH domain